MLEYEMKDEDHLTIAGAVCQVWSARRFLDSDGKAEVFLRCGQLAVTLASSLTCVAIAEGYGQAASLYAELVEKFPDDGPVAKSAALIKNAMTRLERYLPGLEDTVMPGESFTWEERVAWARAVIALQDASKRMLRHRFGDHAGRLATAVSKEITRAGLHQRIADILVLVEEMESAGPGDLAGGLGEFNVTLARLRFAANVIPGKPAREADPDGSDLTLLSESERQVVGRAVVWLRTAGTCLQQVDGHLSKMAHDVSDRLRQYLNVRPMSVTWRLVRDFWTEVIALRGHIRAQLQQTPRGGGYDQSFRAVEEAIKSLTRNEL
jgi:hypothetical protein